MPTASNPTNSYERIYAVVYAIPPGLVSSYGRVAVWAGYPGQARLVGYALHALLRRPPTAHYAATPWWRVVNAQGYISNEYAAAEQRRRLEAEGVTFRANGRIDLAVYGWQPAPGDVPSWGAQ